MSASYKPVLLRCLLDNVDDGGRVPINRLTLAFRDFYLARAIAGLPVEKPRARMARVDELSETDIRQLILNMPFKKFAQLGFLYGPGYRVYFMQRGTALIILLCGGDKREQTQDIESARRIAQDWLKAHP